MLPSAQASCISKTDSFNSLLAMSEFGDVLERFYGVLLERITDTRPEYLTNPFTVSEIYQDLVTYRSYRDVIGLEMNGDYEDALIRMLSGDGDYLMLDSEVARQQMQNELTSPNPNTALFREFAAVDVRLHPSRVLLGAGLESLAPIGVSEAPQTEPVSVGVTAEAFEVPEVDPEAAGATAEPFETSDVDPEAAGATAEVPELPGFDLEMAETGAEMELGLGVPEAAPERLFDSEDDRPSETGTEASGVESVEASKPESGGASDGGVVGHIETATTPPLASLGEEPTDDSVLTVAEHGDVLTVCTWCREDLPVRDSMRFCPFCGNDLLPSPCRECGEEMLARWLFCASCGADKRG